MPDALHFGFLLFPNVEPLDLVGPAQMIGGVPSAQVHLVWKTIDPVTTSKGWQMVPTTTFTDCPKLDVICVPGGIGQIALMDDEETLDFVRRQADGARYVTSVCTGSLVLGAAGLLRGYRAACHWMSRDQLKLLGATPDADRVVKDRNRITGGGVTAGIDFGLTMLAEIYGENVARAVQLATEYDPKPPFHAGSPRGAGAPLAAWTIKAAAERQAERLAATQRAAARLAG